MLSILLTMVAVNCHHSGDAPQSPVAWRVPLVSLGTAPETWWNGVPAATGDLAFFDVGRGIAALELETGAVRWNVQPWPGRAVAGTERLLARDGRVYVVDWVRNQAAALGVADGHTIWSVALDTLRLSFAVAADARSLYVGTKAREIIALDVATGIERWRRNLDTVPWWGGGLSGAAVAGDTLYVAGLRSYPDCPFCSDVMTAALSSVTGEILWKRFEGDSASDAASAPSVAGDVLLTSGGAHGLIAHDRATGATRWRVPGAERYYAMNSPPLVLGDTVVVGDGPVLYAVRLSTGAPLYSTELRSSITYIAACGGKVLVSRQALDMVDARTHRVLGTWLDDEYGSDGFITSGFAVSGDRAVVTGSKQVFGLRCR